ncbi:MAG: tRNA pseudouridine(55) synthase TruB [Lachnospiraceae bacterium]
MYNGIINIRKEKGFTSHDVVAKMRGILRQKKIGHTGTLDPDATGVLPVCLGNATKLCDMLTGHEKEYIATLKLGITTTTQDISGEVLAEKEVSISEKEIRSVIASFIGEQEQIPPMYSAIKIDGKRLYELARSGKEVERKPRPVTFYEIEVLSVDMPCLTIRVLCSKGTYIRTLCHDIGQKAGCGAVMTALERTRSGSFDISTAITLQELEKLRDEDGIDRVLIPTREMFADLKDEYVPEKYLKQVKNGNAFPPGNGGKKEAYADGEKVRVLDKTGIFYGVYVFDGDRGILKPYKMFFDGESE